MRCAVRIRYAKDYPATLLGHLDIMALMQRGMRASGWPLEFTRGFNPRIKLSSSPPLSLGFSSECEYIDVSLRTGLSTYRMGLFSRSLIEGITVRDIYPLPAGDPGINNLISGYRYLVEDCGEEPDSGEFSGGRVFRDGDEYYLDLFKTGGNIPNPAKVFPGTARGFRKIKTFMEDSVS